MDDNLGGTFTMKILEKMLDYNMLYQQKLIFRYWDWFR
tara:strand:- start:629 stop:742 length:114 start_codon:yes stop_codon:yes gene_type:complete